jgi:AraC-like DNA-binding protein
VQKTRDLFFILFLVSASVTLNADTLPQDSGFEAEETAREIVSDSSADIVQTTVDSTPAAAETVPRKPRLKTSAQNRRDSTLRALLSALEKEDSLNTLARRNTAATRKEIPAKKRSVRERWQNLVLTARQHPRTAFAAGAAALAIILGLIAVRISQKKAEKRFMTTTRLSLMDSEVRRACVHIEKHFSDPALTPGVVCAAVVTGESFLEALFQKELGMSIASYIAQTRIHHAKQLIKEKPAVEAVAVAAQAGFADVALFKTTFEKLAGHPFEDFPRQ